jgi:hypothetical protein
MSFQLGRGLQIKGEEVVSPALSAAAGFCYWRRRSSRTPNAPQLALAPKGGVIVRMVVESSSGIFARPVWRDASLGGLCVIVEAIFAVAIGARPVGWGSRSQLLGYIRVR